MRKPSIKTLSQCFDDPREARRIFDMSRAELLALPSSAEPKSRWSYCETAVFRMYALNVCGGFHGVESIASERRSNGAYAWAEYLNAGDPYLPTVIYWRGNYRVQGVGDFIAASRINWR